MPTRQEIISLYQLARTALAGTPDATSRYARLQYVKREIEKGWPERGMSGKRLWLLIDETTRVMS